MTDDSSSPATGDPSSQRSNPTTTSIPNPTPPPQQQPQPQVANLAPTQTSVFQPGPPYAPSASLVSSNLPPPPLFRPGMQFTQVANFQNPNTGVPPPGVNSGGVMAAPGSIPYQSQPAQLPNPAGVRPFPPMANGYPGVHGVAPPGSVPPPAY